MGSPMVPEPLEKDVEHLSLKGQEMIRTGDRIHHSAEEHSLGTLPKEHGCERGPPDFVPWSHIALPTRMLKAPTLFSTCPIPAPLFFQIQNQYRHQLQEVSPDCPNTP